MINKLIETLVLLVINIPANASSDFCYQNNYYDAMNNTMPNIYYDNMAFNNNAKYQFPISDNNPFPFFNNGQVPQLTPVYSYKNLNMLQQDSSMLIQKNEDIATVNQNNISIGANDQNNINTKKNYQQVQFLPCATYAKNNGLMPTKYTFLGDYMPTFAIDNKAYNDAVLLSERSNKEVVGNTPTNTNYASPREMTIIPLQLANINSQKCFNSPGVGYNQSNQVAEDNHTNYYQKGHKKTDNTQYYISKNKIIKLNAKIKNQQVEQDKNKQYEKKTGQKQTIKDIIAKFKDGTPQNISRKEIKKNQFHKIKVPQLKNETQANQKIYTNDDAFAYTIHTPRPTNLHIGKYKRAITKNEISFNMKNPYAEPDSDGEKNKTVAAHNVKKIVNMKNQKEKPKKEITIQNVPIKSSKDRVPDNKNANKEGHDILQIERKNTILRIYTKKLVNSGSSKNLNNIFYKNKATKLNRKIEDCPNNNKENLTLPNSKTIDKGSLTLLNSKKKENINNIKNNERLNTKQENNVQKGNKELRTEQKSNTDKLNNQQVYVLKLKLDKKLTILQEYKINPKYPISKDIAKPYQNNVQENKKHMENDKHINEIRQLNTKKMLFNNLAKRSIHDCKNSPFTMKYITRPQSPVRHTSDNIYRNEAQTFRKADWKRVNIVIGPSNKDVLPPEGGNKETLSPFTNMPQNILLGHAPLTERNSPRLSIEMKDSDYVNNTHFTKDTENTAMLKKTDSIDEKDKLMIIKVNKCAAPTVNNERK